MHLALVTSILRPVTDNTIFSTTERIGQTIITLKSVREKIPSVYIVLAEGGCITDSERELLANLSNFLFECNIQHLTKSQGEAALIYNYLTSDNYKTLQNVLTITKLSGRYYLNDKFDNNALLLHEDKFIASFVPRSWSGKPVYKTTYYRIPQRNIQLFIDNLYAYMQTTEYINGFLDIEHAFYAHNIVTHGNVYSSDALGISGLMTGNGKRFDM